VRIQTTRFGTIDIRESSIVEMPDGMLGFEAYKRYVLLEEEQGSLFKWFQCVDEPSLAFILINPMEFFPDYEVELTDKQVERLGLESAEDAVTFTTVTVDRARGRITTNLAGPLVINARTLRAMQIVLSGDRYSTSCLIGESPTAAKDTARTAAAA